MSSVKIVSTLQAAVFLTLLALDGRSRCSADPIVAALDNDDCWSNNTCVPPFQFCDSISRLCQAVKRRGYRYSASDRYYNFWDDDYKVGAKNLVNIKCNEDGNYPAYDCGHFYHCVSGQATLKTCNSPAYPHFDPVLQRCSSCPSCPVFDCVNNFYDRAGLKGALSSFVGYCYHIFDDPQLTGLQVGVQNPLIPHTVTRCYGKDVFNVNTGRCEPRCLQEGLIPDTSDCHKYFLCSLVDAVDVRFAMTALSCPEGRAFRQTDHRCVPEGEVKSCTQERAWPF